MKLQFMYAIYVHTKGRICINPNIGSKIDMEVVFVQAATFVMMPVCLSAKQAAHAHTCG